jgi:hypothetical protein
VRTTHRFLLPSAALSAVALCLVALTPTRAAADRDDGHHVRDPHPVTGAATAVTATSATLNGVVRRGTTSYYFEYGPMTADAASAPTPPQRLAPSSDGAVSAVVEGLTPGTPYHFRVVAVFGRFVVPGADAMFTTAAGPVGTPPPAVAPAPAATATSPITLGESVGVAPVKGTVAVKVPGTTEFTALGAGATVPVGAVLDTRKGTVQLRTAVEGGATQTATFHSGVFEVRQPASGRGLTDIVLRGPALGCPRVRRSGKASARAAAAPTKKRRKRQLWARDKGGRFRTHGKNSVATVRGTSWVTTDTCAGTRTTVREGAVAVRDRHRHRTILVRAGKSYLARRR